MAYTQRAGKLAPRLAQDIQLYDPDHPPPTGLNLLSQVPPVYPNRDDHMHDFISPEACKHNYVTKANQTWLASADQLRRPGMASKVAAMCTKCRRHLQVVVNHNNPKGSYTSFQKQDHVHHLVYKSGRQGGSASLEVTDYGQVAETYHYECTHLSCSAMVSLRILSPLINDRLVYLLTDPDAIRKRAEEAIAANPDRLEGMAIPLPITVLDNLRTYLNNSLNRKELNKPISASNKRFMVAFGKNGIPCQELLEFFKFTHLESGAWQPPKPELEANPIPPFQKLDSIFLDDAILELQALIHHRPPQEKRVVQTSLPPSSSSDILRALDASDYPRSRHTNTFELAPAPFYEDLGAVEDMDASLIVEAYNRQVAVDAGNSSLYLESLKAIGTLRGGQDWEIIDQAVQVAYADGKYTNDDVIEAYKYFGLWHDDPNLTDDTITGKFYAFLSAAGSHETEARQQLWRIGNSRASERIKAVSEDRVSTVEQAHVFLGVDDKTPDDFIITMYTAKVNDSPSCRDTADRAMKLIAESRNSIVLNHFHSTGETVAGQMDIGDAYRLLQIPDRTADEDAILAAYTICKDDSPDQEILYARALSVIAKEMDSQLLKNFAGVSSEVTTQNPSEWPVGLQNIGNTCYLNSLLQFYFSVRPFRDMVLDIEKYQMDMSDVQSLAQKKVGSRKVTAKEVERSLKFIRELRSLFQNMTISTQTCVTPGRELARLTLISPGNEEAIRRRSTISKIQSSLGDIDGAPILGPLGPPQPLVELKSEQPATSGPSQEEHIRSPAMDDAPSDKAWTPVSGSNESKSSVQPTSEMENTQSQPEKTLPKTEDYEMVDATSDPPVAPEHPSRPPPVPPRHSVEVDPQQLLLEEVEIGAQQDVTEVINNVLFQSQCAIKPRAVASDGEQVDQIKDLFYGETRSYISTQAGIRSKEERWCDIKVDVAHGSRDIYSAIDGAFDAQKISVENSEAEQFGSITRLPPILQIQVQRVQFDPVKKSSFKSTNHLKLLETIYMDRYMDTQKPEIVNKRRQGWELKRTLKLHEDRKLELMRKQESGGQNLTSLFHSTGNVLRELPWDEEDVETSEPLVNEVNSSSLTIDAELEDLDKEIANTQTQISGQFAEYQNLPYRLYAVFVHRGSVSFGHYWIYIYDFNRDMWRKYNDEYVTEVQNLDEIFKNNDPANPPTPYFLVYINANMRDRLVDPVCRDIHEHKAAVPKSETNTAEVVQPTEENSGEHLSAMDISTD
ncbi:hypothetical protein N7532_011885 [Penicillium argentinense]|uniref:ubiquitinyl hydrolase 1 n=1 Tax=Penicillium argentinense TaxID=1131581 RepID=A0A9W9EJA9_9EURO|nr:uncharacterized protein N7532_011885 [Penicillium argentinense]KAJ5082842.1 hypothetical protein N7532_011885 [Penicillium argentinense]